MSDAEINYNTDGFAVIWSESDGEYVGLCERYPSMSWLATTSQEAMTGIRERVAEVSTDIARDQDEPARELTEAMSGQWLVTTQGSTHLWDLDEMYCIRHAGPESLLGEYPTDGVRQRIQLVKQWPRVGEVFHVVFSVREWWVSSTVRSIEPYQPHTHR